jgi:hypothetical protein
VTDGWLNRCHFGNVIDVLQRMADAGVRVNCIVTSPPPPSYEHERDRTEVRKRRLRQRDAARNNARRTQRKA